MRRATEARSPVVTGRPAARAPVREAAPTTLAPTTTSRSQTPARTGSPLTPGRAAQAVAPVQTAPTRIGDRSDRPGPVAGLRSYEPYEEAGPALRRTERDSRIDRPHPDHVQQRHRSARHAPPRHRSYRGCYGRWWVHPYWRSYHATWAVVWFGFGVDPWSPYWAPPVRWGWTWYPGGWVSGVWWPGYWSPTTTITIQRGNHYVYVPGWWEDEVYVEGYWRRAERDDGDWFWVDGYYLDDGTYIRGHWSPAEAGPEGYVWEPGFWDGEVWNGGFWRPQYRKGFRWLASWYDEDGIFNAGYWEPTEIPAGQVWIPGWFDGNAWIEGYFVTEAEYQRANPEAWTPEAGWDAGRDSLEAAPPQVLEDDAPLALPVELPAN